MTSFAALIKPQDDNTWGVADYDYTYGMDIFGAQVEYMKDVFSPSLTFYKTQSQMLDRTTAYYQALGKDSMRSTDIYQAELAAASREFRLPDQDKIEAAVDADIIARRQVDPEKWGKIKTYEEIREPLREEARLSKEAFEDAYRRAAPSAWKTASSLAGGFVGMLHDPVNLATTFLGAGAGKTLGQVVLTEALIGAGTEIAQQPGVYAWHKEIGEEYSVEDAVTNVAFAGFGSAAFPVLMKGGAMALKQAGKIAGLPPEKLRMLDLWERNVEISKPPEGIPITGYTLDAHAGNVYRAAELLDQGIIPTKKDFDLAAMPRSFDPMSQRLRVPPKTPIITYDHHNIAESLRAGNIKPDSDVGMTKIKQEYMDSVKAEAEAVLSDKMMAKEIAGIDKKVAATEKKIAAIDKKDYEKEYISALGEKKNSPTHVAVAKLQAAAAKQKDKADAVAEIARLKQAKQEADKIPVYQSDLDAVKNGEIPERLKGDFDSFAKGVRAAYKDPPVRVDREVAPKIEERIESLKKAEKDPEIKAAQEQATKVAITNDPSILNAGYADEYGARSVADVLDELDDDEKMLEALKICAFGGGK